MMQQNQPQDNRPPERPLWQRIAAWILIVLIVAATGVYALWGR